MKIYLESLGCAKNQVDSEIMLGRLAQAGWTLTDDPGEAHTIVVNTCSFIESAAQESIDTILELAEYKSSGCCRRLVVSGCLPERYREQIVQTLPEVDFFLGTGAFDQIVVAVGNGRLRHEVVLPDPDLARPEPPGTPRVRATPHLAYLKVAEGCSRSCTYCVIPKLRGRHKSRPAADVEAEARELVAAGARELILVAQDTTAYGRDLSPPVSLGQLVESLAAISANAAEGADPAWVRVLYGHPESIGEDFIDSVAAHPNVCPYFDVPIQHASDKILKRMGRRYSRAHLRRLFRRIRAAVPHAALRTTVIVGFPGETDKDFQEVLDFAEEIRFDHLGVFVYSDADDIPSHRLRGHVPAALAQERFDQLMSSQVEIAAAINQVHIGKRVQVLIEEDLGNNLFAGRTCFQAPEVDGVTYVNSALTGRGLAVGSLAWARVTDAMEYDLMGESA
jgi:ribosomal protein S12 methylthiotransferase